MKNLYLYPLLIPLPPPLVTPPPPTPPPCTYASVANPNLKAPIYYNKRCGERLATKITPQRLRWLCEKCVGSNQSRSYITLFLVQQRF